MTAIPATNTTANNQLIIILVLGVHLSYIPNADLTSSVVSPNASSLSLTESFLACSSASISSGCFQPSGAVIETIQAVKDAHPKPE